MSFSAFTSSMNSRGDLEATFTAREGVADTIMASIRDTTVTHSAHNLLITGPRGIGKTHLVSLAYYRTRELDMAERIRIAWLPEDPYRAGASYGALLNEIMDYFAKEYGLGGWVQRRSEIRALIEGQQKRRIGDFEREIELALEKEIEKVLDGRAMLLLSENFDDLLAGIGDKGRKRLRAFLQTRVCAVLVCTATSISSHVADRDSAFFGFFRRIELEPFNFSACLALMTRMAERRQNEDILHMLATPQGAARVRSIHHLAGGNPRVYVIFYEFLARGSLESLRRPFMDLIDHLLPYYQSRMQLLSPAQRRYVDIIRTNERPMAVRDIALEAMTSSQSASNDLGILVEKGYLISTKAGRESLYELREPLMRIALAAKDERGNAVPLFIEFLSIWFSQKDGFQVGAGSFGAEIDLYAADIAAVDSRWERLAAFAHQKISAARAAGELEIALVHQRSLYDRFPSQTTWHTLRVFLDELGRREEIIVLLRERTMFDENCGPIWNDLCFVLHSENRLLEALDASEKAVAISPDNSIFRLNHLSSLIALDRKKEAIEVARGIEASCNPTDSWDHSLLALAMQILERDEQSIRHLVAAIRLDPSNSAAWAQLINLLDQRGAIQAVQAWTRLVEDYPLDADVHLHTKAANACARDNYAELLTITESPGAERIRWVKHNRFVALVLLGLNERADAYAKSNSESIFNPGYLSSYGFLGMSKMIRGDWAAADHAFETWFATKAELGLVQTGASCFKLLRLTSDRTIWRKATRLLIDVHRRWNVLPQLGVALIRGVLSPSFGILTKDALDDWVDIWREEAATVEELALPTRIAGVAAAVRTTLSRKPMLELTIDHRALLEPDVAIYLAAAGIEAHPLDDVVNGAIDELRPFLKKHSAQLEKAKNQIGSRFRFSDPAPELDRQHVAALLDGYRVKSSSSGALAPLMPLPQKALTKTQAMKWVERIWESDDSVAHVLSHEDSKLVKIEFQSLTFGNLYQLHLRFPDGMGALDVLAVTEGDQEKLLLVTGNSAMMKAAYVSGFLSPDIANDPVYSAFFCAALRAEGGRFSVQDPSDPKIRRVLKGAGREEPDLAPFVEDGVMIVPLLIEHGDALFLAKVTGGDEPWQQAMIDDEPVATELNWRREAFDGPVRMWASSANSGRSTDKT